MDLGIRGKYALVTGGSHGIGKAIALAFADEGCNVAVCARDKKRLDETVKEIKAKSVEGIGIPADVMIPADIEKTVQNIIKTWGTLHILVNNVGGGGRWGREVVEDTLEEVWMDVYTKNALAAIRFTMRMIPYMIKQKWGRVVTVTSICGREGGGRPWFNMAKSAEISLMKTLAMDIRLVRQGITFNSVAPGAIMIEDTGWAKEAGDNPAAFKQYENSLPLGHLGSPEEVASAVVFLCSQKASLINGACVTVDGGESRSF